jgi:hydroxymethylbilane synthase
LQSQPLQIGTRGSPLALWQAEDVRQRLRAAHGLPADLVRLSIITTSGDRIQDKPLREFGGKGLFTKEIDEALLDGRVDLAVHSMKDLPTTLSPGLRIACVLPREDVRDAFVSNKADGLSALPSGSVVGTSSLRRQAQVRRVRPDLEVIDLRGNVETRLRKLADGVADATIVALAGLKRLGLDDCVTSILSTEEMLPAVAQGAIAVVCRDGDEKVEALLKALNDTETEARVACERAFLAVLDGSCKTPIAGLAEFDAHGLVFRGLVITPDGRQHHAVSRAGADPVALGRASGEELVTRVGREFIASL